MSTLQPIPDNFQRVFPCHRGPLLAFRMIRQHVAEQWWEQQCPHTTCLQRWRFVRRGREWGCMRITRWTEPEQGDRSLPVDTWTMALAIVREREAA